jgi:hypothetical protein
LPWLRGGRPRGPDGPASARGPGPGAGGRTAARADRRGQDRRRTAAGSAPRALRLRVRVRDHDSILLPQDRPGLGTGVTQCKKIVKKCKWRSSDGRPFGDNQKCASGSIFSSSGRSSAPSPGSTRRGPAFILLKRIDRALNVVVWVLLPRISSPWLVAGDRGPLLSGLEDRRPPGHGRVLRRRRGARPRLQACPSRSGPILRGRGRGVVASLLKAAPTAFTQPSHLLGLADVRAGRHTRPPPSPSSPIRQIRPLVAGSWRCQELAPALERAGLDRCTWTSARRLYEAAAGTARDQDRIQRERRRPRSGSLNKLSPGRLGRPQASGRPSSGKRRRRPLSPCPSASSGIGPKTEDSLRAVRI